MWVLLSSQLRERNSSSGSPIRTSHSSRGKTRTKNNLMKCLDSHSTICILFKATGISLCQCHPWLPQEADQATGMMASKWWIPIGSIQKGLQSLSSRLFNLKHIKTNINDELIIKGEKDKSRDSKELSQPKTVNHLSVVGSSPVFPVWRSVDLHVQPIIIADSHSLAWEMWGATCTWRWWAAPGLG